MFYLQRRLEGLLLQKGGGGNKNLAAALAAALAFHMVSLRSSVLIQSFLAEMLSHGRLRTQCRCDIWQCWRLSVDGLARFAAK